MADPPQQTSSRTNEEHQTEASAKEATLKAETKSVTNSTRSSVTSGDTGSQNQGRGTTNTTKPANICQNRASFQPSSRPPINPYAARSTNDKNTNEQNRPPFLDKAIVLKRGVKRLYIHWYDLRIKVKACQTEEEEFRCV
jgi:hypothetical protein